MLSAWSYHNELQGLHVIHFMLLVHVVDLSVYTYRVHIVCISCTCMLQIGCYRHVHVHIQALSMTE